MSSAGEDPDPPRRHEVDTSRSGQAASTLRGGLVVAVGSTLGHTSAVVSIQESDETEKLR
ncbi:hypothetical protein TPA0908_32830 [Micromonospora sp. AKA38]|nr:hypothetical protein TPA0908_32830 [Micromonospora sp. AKA38]